MMLFVSRRRHQAELAAVRAEADRLRTGRDEANAQRDAFRNAAAVSTRQFAEADATNRRLAGRITALKRQLRITEEAAGIDHSRAEEVRDRLRTVQDAAARGREQVASGGEAS